MTNQRTSNVSLPIKMPSNCFECPLFSNCDACEGHECYCGILGCIGYEEDVSKDRRRDDCPLGNVRNTGNWIEDRMDYRCSVCGKTVKDEIVYMLEPYQFPAFCPYCGAKLEPPEEENE